MMPQIPLASGSGQIVIEDTPGACTGVKDAVISDIDGHVIDPSTGTGKQEQITWTEGFKTLRNESSSRSLKARRAGQIDTVSAIHVLHEPRTIETLGRGFASIVIMSTEVLLGRGEHARGTGAYDGGGASAGCRGPSWQRRGGTNAYSVSSQGGDDCDWTQCSPNNGTLESSERDIDLRSHYARNPGQKRQDASDKLHDHLLGCDLGCHCRRCANT
jgi:hypothetical protein